MRIKEFYESHTPEEQKYWKEYLTGTRSFNKTFVFSGQFQDDRPLFSVSYNMEGYFIDKKCEEHGHEGTTIFCTAVKNQSLKYLHNQTVNFCYDILEILEYKLFVKRRLSYFYSFLKPYPYSSLSTGGKGFLFLLFLISRRVEIPEEMMCHISSFIRVCEMP